MKTKKRTVGDGSKTPAYPISIITLGPIRAFRSQFQKKKLFGALPVSMHVSGLGRKPGCYASARQGRSHLSGPFSSHNSGAETPHNAHEHALRNHCVYYPLLDIIFIFGLVIPFFFLLSSPCKQRPWIGAVPKIHLILFLHNRDR